MANKDLIIRSDVMTVEQKVMGLIGCIAQEGKVEMERRIAPLNLSPLQLSILHALDWGPDGGMTVGQLKSVMLDESPNMSRTLNKMVDAGLVAKRRSTEDQRIVHITITDAGRQMHKTADSELTGMSTGLAETDLQQLYRLLQKL